MGGSLKIILYLPIFVALVWSYFNLHPEWQNHGSSECTVFLFDLILYVPVNNPSVMSVWVFLGWSSTKLGLMWVDSVNLVITLQYACSLLEECVH